MKIDGIIKGDSLQLECNIKEDITNWKIRCEIYDGTQKIRLATSNVTGGSDNQIEVTDATNGIFLVKVKAGDTTDFADNSNIEIEVDTDQTVGGETEKLTIFQGEVDFKGERITWDTTTD